MNRYKWVHLVIILIVGILYLKGQQPFEPIKYKCSILKPKYTLSFSNSELLKHDTNLISTLQERESWNIATISSEKDGILQLRSIYIGVISIVFALTLRKRSKRKMYLMMALIIITVFALLDIHLEDLLNRNVENRDLTSRSLDSLINQKPNDVVWYELNYHDRDSIYTRMSNSRLNRKAHLIFVFNNLVEDIFYKLPWVITYILLTEIFVFRKFRKSKNKNKMLLKRITTKRKY